MVNSMDNQIASPAQNVRGEDLFTSEAVQTLQKYVAHLREYVLLQEAWEAARNLEELFSLAPQASAQFPGAYQAMQTLLWQCRAICFPLLEDDEVAELFGTHVGLVIDVHGGELWNMVRALMVKEYDYKKRDALKERLLTRLLHSQERITSKGPLLGGKEATPTVENWIMDYVASVGTGQADAFKRSAWLTRSPSIVRLSEQEKIRVRLAMMLRDKLPISSTALEGLEEVISENNKGRPVWLREGRLEEMPESQYAEYKTGVTAAVQARTEAYREAREKAARELLLEKYEKWTGIKEFSQSIVLPKCGSDRLREADLQTATSVVRSAGQACATRLALESINNQARLVDAIKFVRVDTEGGEAVTITMTMVTQGETT